ncbi:MAG: Fis family transcriptional regulator [Betaproteobacteria bacterium]|nr:Fis family transcriptional regulator [Betaproteobacteria bacterium]
MPHSHSKEDFPRALSGALNAHFKDTNGSGGGNLYRMVMASVEAELLGFALGKCGGNCSEAARMLGISRTTLMRKKAAAERLHEN